LADFSTTGAGNPEFFETTERLVGEIGISGFRRILRAAVRNLTPVTKKTRTEVSLEIQEELAIRTHRILMADCPDCGSEVRMIPANEAAMMAKVTARDIYRLVGTGELHFKEDRLGLLYICSESLGNLRRIEPDATSKAADISRE
jgi:hypothetical protein